ncbi:MAG TPA: Asp-tRNA(Asn)/Glu-tRNA(Gln) amidotransferase subunit GatB [Microthrixaceae bacterium]|nr:Asp-tRNA(Asn)/Glu-tRNA(Gln) amidotransferase subunit GatB [Microthrixaceae bacterium]
MTATTMDTALGATDPQWDTWDVRDGWETVIGLEVHTELLTATKLFSSSPNHFGGEPNTHIDPVSLGLPGSLPVLNRQAVELAIRAGLALGCSVQRSIFARKNYFYPDMPKDYQISQYELPINIEGQLELPGGKVIGIERAHLEEDTGKSTHATGGESSGRIHDAEYSLVDYNRAGVPLLEIVGRPDLRSPDEAKAYVSELRSVLVAVGASDGKMEEGSLRVDCNVSVRRRGDDTLGTRCEIKNVNSLRSLGRAIEYEASRQVDLLEAGERVRQETRHWNEDEGRTLTLRSKEEATDYRYFPEPDLVELDPDPEWVEEIRAGLPMLPRERRAALTAELGATATTAALVVERGLDELVLAAAGSGGDAGRLLTHAEHNLSDERAVSLDPTHFAELTTLEVGGSLTATQAKQVLVQMVGSGRSPSEIAAERGFESMDSTELESILDGLIAAHPDDWAKYTAGEDKVAGFFVGQVMKATGGKADGKAVTALLRQRRG